MGSTPQRASWLDRYYQKYLLQEDSASFVANVASYYTVPVLERLVDSGARTTRRAAALAIGFLGDFSSNATLGRALQDDDRGVRLLAEDGLPRLWCRDGTIDQQHLLQAAIRWNECGEFHRAASATTQVLSEAQWFAEAWNQRAIAYYQLQRYSESLRDCRQAMKHNPYHFAAAVGMGHCYLEMFDGLAALECFRWALQVNPSMESVRAQVGYLQRSLEEK